jgi:hypothetical protein
MTSTNTPEQSKANGADFAAGAAARHAAQAASARTADLHRAHSEATGAALKSGIDLVSDAAHCATENVGTAVFGDRANEAVTRSVATMDAASAVFQEMSTEWMRLARESAETTREAARAFMQCRSPQAFFKQHARLVNDQCDLLTRSNQRMTELARKSRWPCEPNL